MNILKVQDVLKTKKFKAANGETVSGKQYLDDAIAAFELPPCDYDTVFKLLVWIADGRDAEIIVKEIKDFWESLEKKYGK